jgi:hypothetical protein
MTTTTNANWAPLERRLNNDTAIIREFMWMYSDEESGVEYYKHAVTRQYLLLGRDGQCYQQGAPGLVKVEFDSELRRVRRLEAH